MTMSPTIARRSATMMASTTHRALTAPTAAAAFSTQIQAQVKAVEDALVLLRWSAAKDEMKCIRAFMNENKTNHAIKMPDPTFEDTVTKNIHDIQKMIAQNRPSHAVHDEVFARTHGLKRMVKEQLYQFAN